MDSGSWQDRLLMHFDTFEEFNDPTHFEMVGPGRFELPTSRLSGVRSNQLSYGPLLSKALEAGTEAELYLLLMPAVFMNHTINKPIIHRPL